MFRWTAFQLTLDMQRMNIFDCSETDQKEESIPVHQKTSPKVSLFYPNSKSSSIKPENSQTYYKANMRKENSLNDTFGRNIQEQNTDIKMITWLILGRFNRNSQLKTIMCTE